MTTAPAGLLEARRLLLDHLDMHPGQVVPADLDPAEVGIIGDAAHLGGYHCGVDRVDRNSAGTITDYSVVESPRDRAGLDLDASAMDVGEFSVTTARGTFDLRDFSAWLVGECERAAPDTLDIREVIYSLDGVTVKRWDRLKKRTSGSASHLTHTHISEHRDANGRNMTALMRRWLAHIGLLEDDVSDLGWVDANQRNADRQRIFGLVRNTDIDLKQNPPIAIEENRLAAATRRIEAGIAELLARPPVVAAPVDPAAIEAAVRRVLAEPDVLAKIADTVNDDAARRAAE